MTLRPRRLVALAALALVLVGALASCDQAVPFNDQRHWPRSTGYQTLIYVHVGSTAASKGYTPLVDNALADWNASPRVHLVRASSSCVNTAVNCITLGYGNQFAGGDRCGEADQFVEPWGSDTHYKQWGSAISVAFDITGCSGDLQFAQHVVCHEFGHALGLTDDPVGEDGDTRRWPCGGDGNAATHPTQAEIDRVTILHFDGHPGTWFPPGIG